VWIVWIELNGLIDSAAVSSFFVWVICYGLHLKNQGSGGGGVANGIAGGDQALLCP